MKTRYRIQRIKDGLLSSRDVLVLQVYKTVVHMSMDSIDHADVWVDATVEDLTEMTGQISVQPVPNVVPAGWRYRAAENTSGWTYCDQRPPKVWAGVELIVERIYAGADIDITEIKDEQRATMESAVPTGRAGAGR